MKLLLFLISIILSFYSFNQSIPLDFQGIDKSKLISSIKNDEGRFDLYELGRIIYFENVFYSLEVRELLVDSILFYQYKKKQLIENKITHIYHTKRTQKENVNQDLNERFRKVCIPNMKGEESMFDLTFKGKFDVNQYNEILDGEYSIFFNKNPTPLSEMLILKCFFKDGDLNGDFEMYNRFKETQIISTFQNGLLHGNYELYQDESDFSSKTSNYNVRKDLEFQRKFLNLIKEKGDWLNGEKTGIWEEYSYQIIESISDTVWHTNNIGQQVGQAKGQPQQGQPQGQGQGQERDNTIRYENERQINKEASSYKIEIFTNKTYKEYFPNGIIDNTHLQCSYTYNKEGEVNNFKIIKVENYIDGKLISCEGECD